MANVPKAFLCPITQELMTDPVIGPDGHSYDRRSITEWLRNSPTSPMTRQHMTVNDLKVNYNLRELIEEFVQSNNVTAPPKTPAPPVQNPNPPVSNKIFNFEVINIDDEVFSIKLFDENPEPRVVIAVLDVSGSMDLDACEKSPNEELKGFSRLDLVKHSMKTIIEMMTDQYLGIVQFNDAAKIQLVPKLLDSRGKIYAAHVVESLQSDGGTNIWAGLKQALSLIETQPICQNKTTSIVLLTDGEPSSQYIDFESIQTSLTKYIKQHPTLKFNIHCFGFGYNLDSKVMFELSELGRGGYGYIPDASMVGTVFVNAISGILSTAVHDFSIFGNYIGHFSNEPS